MPATYRFDERSYAALAAAGIAWQDALYVLRNPPRVRHHIGATLRVAGRTPAVQWIGVAAVEEGDDEYLIVGGHVLDADEVDAVTKMMQGGAT